MVFKLISQRCVSLSLLQTLSANFFNEKLFRKWFSEKTLNSRIADKIYYAYHDFVFENIQEKNEKKIRA